MTALKERLRAGGTSVGGLLRLPGEFLVELAGAAGLGHVLIDCEHGPADLVALQRHITAAEAHGLDVLVRVGSGDPGMILRVLDLGATGIVVPHVDTAADARAAVAAAHYPPLGTRGFATYSRAGRFGATSIPDHLRRSAGRTVVVVMAETPEACANAGEIAAIEGVDAIMVGPADLSVALGLAGGAAEPAVRAATDVVRSAAAGAGVAMATIVNDPPQAAAAPPGLVVYNLAHVLLQTFRRLAV